MNKNKGVSKDVQTPQFLERKPQNLPQSNLNPKFKQPDLNRKLLTMPIDSKYKDVLGPDTASLVAYLKQKKKKEKAIQKLKDSGKIQIIKEPKQQIDRSLPQGIYETEEGKLKDISGKIIRLNDQAKSLKINQERQKLDKIQEMLKIQNNLKDALNDKGRFLDKNVTIQRSNIKRQKRKLLAFNFIENGNKDKEQVQQTSIQPQDEEKEKIEVKEIQNLTTTSVQTSFKRVCVKMKHHDPIPNIEWWDLPLFPEYQANYIPLNIESEQEHKQPATAHTQEEIQKNITFLEKLQYTDTNILLDKITKLLEHPKPFIISELVQNREKAALPSFLTKKERKKRLRKIRMDIQKEKQDKIRLGLQKPSPPRITLQNMMAILGAEAQIDPSKAEQEVRRQIQARLDKHIKQNEERKLTKEQRGDKLKQKWQKDAAQEIRVAVFRIDEDLSSTDLETKKLKFKVDMNAQQVSLQGVCLIANQNGQQIVPSILVAEGGPKGIKFYKKLLLNRIKWRCDDSKLGCTLVWEGVAKQHAFNKWRTIEIKSEAEGKRILAEKGVEQFWDLAMNNHQN
ncbi:unnamed protein product (macronuclear) [Paramecium tetraurelia]|uniref:Uncharacterized protein n=1 Tax=Paramecium tetraurelia TaxID=5888 RepID=A0CSY0_PARTE|nr:uncharacterized protein GSPATT00010170001 [Paramecium tetraurelia]CAK73897.1 unnamed protein product [Paramecium tetraurelia]|eukprot:XP_001441294.1 hypothetical protein (macronuclear) [Paramecium tetraurelia strain d4-2]